MSCKFPMGVATIYKPKGLLIICFLFTFLISCTPVNLVEDNEKKQIEIKKNDQKITTIEKEIKYIEEKTISEKNNLIDLKNTKLDKTITVLLKKNGSKINNQFINVLELAVFEKNFQQINLEFKFFNNTKELESIIADTKKVGKIYIGPIDSNSTSFVSKFCKNGLMFFSFSSNANLAQDCVFLLNFFPKNELDQLFKYLENDSKVALLYPENSYGYLINSLIDEVANKSNAVIVNRSSYKNDLSNVRESIKELGKYNLRKYELDRQKKILITKNDSLSKKRLKKLEKFKTTTDYDFTHILIADYGINMLQVAPLLPYYDIDPEIVQFMATGVIDDDNFFYEPSLQGAIFPGIEKNKRSMLLKQYSSLYDENFNRISTLPYDLIGLLNFAYSKNMTVYRLNILLNSPDKKFDGVDGNFYFKNNMIERDLQILKINNGNASKVSQ